MACRLDSSEFARGSEVSRERDEKRKEKKRSKSLEIKCHNAIYIKREVHLFCTLVTVIYIRKARTRFHLQLTVTVRVKCNYSGHEVLIAAFVVDKCKLDLLSRVQGAQKAEKHRKCAQVAHTERRERNCMKENNSPAFVLNACEVLIDQSKCDRRTVSLPMS